MWNTLFCAAAFLSAIPTVGVSAVFIDTFEEHSFGLHRVSEGIHYSSGLNDDEGSWSYNQLVSVSDTAASFGMTAHFNGGVSLGDRVISGSMVSNYGSNFVPYWYGYGNNGAHITFDVVSTVGFVVSEPTWVHYSITSSTELTGGVGADTGDKADVNSAVYGNLSGESGNYDFFAASGVAGHEGGLEQESASMSGYLYLTPSLASWVAMEYRVQLWPKDSGYGLMDGYFNNVVSYSVSIIDGSPPARFMAVVPEPTCTAAFLIGATARRRRARRS